LECHAQAAQEVEGRIFRGFATDDLFFVALHLVVVIRVLMAKGGHFEPLSTTSITVASLILGKAVLIADMVPAINRYPDKPLAYNVAWKTAIYWLLATGYCHPLFGKTHRSRPAGR
jgi:hypothetical protein